MKKLEKIKLLTLIFFKNFIRSKAGKSIFYSIIILMIFLTFSILPSRNAEKLFLNASYSLVSFIIFFLSVFGSCELLRGEIKESTIQFLLTKPIKPKEIIISKWITMTLIIFLSLFIYVISFHILSFILFQKYFLKMDLSFITIFLSSLLLSSFTFFLTSIYPSISTAVFVIIFGTGLIDNFLKALLYAKTYNIYGLIGKKIGIFVLYFLFYLFPSNENIVLKPDELIWNKTFLLEYSKYFIYAISGTAFYLFLSIYIFGLKRKSYLKW